MQIMKMKAISCMGDMPMPGPASLVGSGCSSSFSCGDGDLDAGTSVLASFSLPVDCLSRDESAVLEAMVTVLILDFRLAEVGLSRL